MRRAVLIGLGLAVPVVLIAADLLAQLGWDRDRFESACFEFVRAEDYLAVPSLPKGVKLLAVGQRKTTVEALGAQAKAYYASEAFKKRWIEQHGGRYRDPNEAKQKAEQNAMIKKGMGQQKKAMDDMEKMIPMMPPEVQAQMRANIAKSKVAMAKEESKQGGREDRGSSDSGNNANIPDAKVALRKSLERFLKLSENVDFSAATTKQGYRVTFVNPAYESKPDAWKAIFRAGKEATEAARAYARTWLAELK